MLAGSALTLLALAALQAAPGKTELGPRVGSPLPGFEVPKDAEQYPGEPPD